MPVGRMMRELSSAELTEYMAFDSIDPIGEGRADLRAGIIAATVANHGMSPPRQPASPADFMPLQRAREPILAADAVEHGRLIAATLFGNQVKK